VISAESLEFLASSAGQRILDHLADVDDQESAWFSALMHLRRELPADLAGAALELAQLRRLALARFGESARHMYFTREALQQASDPLIRAWRTRFAEPGSQWIDACCSIGSDSIALASRAASVTGLDTDPVRIRMAALNAEALGSAAVFALADVTTAHIEADAVFFDPARRSGERRIHDVNAMLPPLATLHRWKTGRVLVKLSPGVQTQQLSGIGGMLHFVSVRGDLKEALLDTRPGGAGALDFAAVLIDHERVLDWLVPDSLPPPVLHEPLTFFLEPDAALMRAGLITDAAAQWGAYQLDETTAVLTANHVPATPWMRAWRVLEWMPFSMKRVRAALRVRGMGHIDVKTRGTAVSVEVALSQLKVKGDNAGVVVLTRFQGKQIAIICEAGPLPPERSR
jgi:predicted RNA methylase